MGRICKRRIKKAWRLPVLDQLVVPRSVAARLAALFPLLASAVGRRNPEHRPWRAPPFHPDLGVASAQLTPAAWPSPDCLPVRRPCPAAPYRAAYRAGPYRVAPFRVAPSQVAAWLDRPCGVVPAFDQQAWPLAAESVDRAGPSGRAGPSDRAGVPQPPGSWRLVAAPSRG